MKIRTDFVTNSSSSSYCTVRIDTDEGRVVSLEDKDTLECHGHGTFMFHDPTTRLAAAHDKEDLLDAIVYAVEGNSDNMSIDLLEDRLDAIEDISALRSIRIECGESFGGGDWGSRDVSYSYDFRTGERIAKSNRNWRYYDGWGDSLRPEFRTLNGETLPFEFGNVGGRFCVTDYSGDSTEVVLPERVLEDGKERVVLGIGPKCFAKRKTLETLVLPRTVEYISKKAFDGVKRSLRSVRFSDTEEGETSFVRDGAKLILAISPERELTVPDDVTELGDWALAGCWNLRSLILHDGMKKPTVKTLQSCSGLAYVVLTDGSKISVSKKDAMRCFTISRGVIRYDYGKCETFGIKQPGHTAAKRDASKPPTAAELRRIWGTRKLPDGTLRIESWKGVQPVAIVPERIGRAAVSKIGYQAFSPYAYANRRNKEARRNVLREIVIPEGVRYVEYHAFDNCSALRKLDFPSSLGKASSRLYESLDLDRLILRSGVPQTIKKIGRGPRELCISGLVEFPGGSDDYKLEGKKILFHSSMSEDDRATVRDRVAQIQGDAHVEFGEWE